MPVVSPVVPPVAEASQMNKDGRRPRGKKKRRLASFLQHINKRFKVDGTIMDPKTQVVKVWKELKTHLRKIYAPSDVREALSQEIYMQFYEEVHSLCTVPPCELGFRSIDRFNGNAMDAPRLLYLHIEQFLRTHLEDIAKQGQCIDDHLQILKYYSKQCADFLSSSEVLNGICMYLNRHMKTSKQSSVTYDIIQLALVTWRNSLFQKLSAKVTNSILEIIQQDRSAKKGKDFSHADDIKTVIQSYVDIGCFDELNGGENLMTYQKSFEEMFIEETGSFYKEFITDLIKDNSSVQAILECNEVLEEEEARVAALLHESTTSKVVENCLQTFVMDRLEHFYTAFKKLLENDMHTELSSLYAIIRRLPQKYISEMAQKFRGLVVEIGNEKLEPELRKELYPDVFGTKLFNFIDKYRHIVNVCFNGNAEYKGALDRACVNLINSKNDDGDAQIQPIFVRTGELLASYVDIVMRKRNSKVSGNKTDEEILNQISSLLEFVEDKDMFQRYHKFRFQNRLISNSSNSSKELEDDWITKLDKLCNQDYVRKLRIMYKDAILTSDTITKEFKEKVPNCCGFDFRVCVLASSAWSMPLVQDFKFPPELADVIAKFTQFHISKHSNHKLIWNDLKTSGELTYNTEKKKYVLVVSTNEMAVLLLFNSNDRFTFAQIREETHLDYIRIQNIVANLEKARLVSTIQQEDQSSVEQGKSTSFAATPESTPATSQVNPSRESNTKPQSTEEKEREAARLSRTIVEINHKFASDKYKIFLNAPLKRDVNREEDKMSKDVQMARGLQLQAALVRLMKARQSLHVQNLISEVVQECKKQNNFSPVISQVKKQIDALIKKDYLKQDPVTKVISYVA